MGKGEVARYKQFLLFPQCFQKACFQGASKGVIVWEWLKLHVLLIGRASKSFGFSAWFQNFALSVHPFLKFVCRSGSISSYLLDQMQTLHTIFYVNLQICSFYFYD